jgi:hypothetical protein
MVHKPDFGTDMVPEVMNLSGYILYRVFQLDLQNVYHLSLFTK